MKNVLPSDRRKRGEHQTFSVRYASIFNALPAWDTATLPCLHLLGVRNGPLNGARTSYCRTLGCCIIRRYCSSQIRAPRSPQDSTCIPAKRFTAGHRRFLGNDSAISHLYHRCSVQSSSVPPYLHSMMRQKLKPQPQQPDKLSTLHSHAPLIYLSFSSLRSPAHPAVPC